MRILAINQGSSSLKAALIETESGARLAVVHVERIGTPECVLHCGQTVRKLGSSASVAGEVLKQFEISNGSPPDAVVHRVVHGGAAFKGPVIIDDKVIRQLEGLDQLAPLHNRPALAVIRECRAVLPSVTHIAVFDTSFHSTLPRRAREYALPRELTQQLGIRRFGFHGLSHEHAMHAAAKYLQAPAQSLRIIACHLGNGASVTAIEYGRSIETSMGMTPLEGLVMGSRAGDIDPGVLLYLLREDRFDVQRLDELLNRNAGLKGLAGNDDMREIESRAAAGDDACRLALAIFAHRVRKYIGAYAAVMGGVDVITFTGGIGENSAAIRHRIVQRLQFIGVVLDEQRNRAVELQDDLASEISSSHSRVKVLVLKANEEEVMAKAAAKLLSAKHQVKSAAPIPVAVSARHAHLSQPTLDRLFGQGYRLKVRSQLSQHGQYAAQETVTLVGPRGRLEHVRLMGPPRAEDQVEISRSDEFTLGVDAPVRISGDLKNSPGITIEGPAGSVELSHGLICAQRHIHMNPDDAKRLHVSDHDCVQVRLDGNGRSLVFDDVMIRVAPDFALELHLDTDEANAAGVQPGETATIIFDSAHQAR